ncbi:MAG: MarR family winged helix-turn-helix transcriptional regulator [Alphaproteobacteria bacterium]
MKIQSPTDCPYFLVSRVSLAITAELKRELSDAGAPHVKPAYLGVLMSLWLEDGLKVIELGRRAGLEPSTMTGLLDRMERDKLVTRAVDPDDRRAQLIHLTRLGRKAKIPVLKVVNATLSKIMNGIQDKEIEQMKATLRRVLTNVGEEAGA